MGFELVDGRFVAGVGEEVGKLRGGEVRDADLEGFVCGEQGG